MLCFVRNATSAVHTVSLVHENVVTFGVQGDQVVFTAHLDVTLIVYYENADLAALNIKAGLDKHNITVIIFRLHAVTGDANGIVGTLGDRGGSDQYSFRKTL